MSGVGKVNQDISPLKTFVSGIFQDGLLVGTFMKALGVTYQYELAYSLEPVPKKAGETFTFSRDKLLGAVQQPLAGSLTDLNSGITIDDTTPSEQWTIEMERYADAKNTHYDDNLTAFGDLYKRHARMLGEQAGRTNDIQCRRPLSCAVFGGRTHATDAETTGATAMAVANLEGFDVVHSAAGIPQAVSVSNPLTITIDGTANTAVGNSGGTLDTASDLTPGSLTLGTSTTWAIGDAIIAENAAKTIRPNNRTTSYDLTSSDTLSLDLIHDGVTSLLEAGVEPWDDEGHFLFLGSYKHENALKKDTNFTLYYEGREDTDVFRKGRIREAAGVLFSFGNQTPRSTSFGANSITVNRGFLVGRDAAMKCHWNMDGLETEMMVDTENHFIYKDPSTGIELVGRYPIDVLAKTMTTAWELQFGVDITTDVLSDLGDVPDAPCKRIVGYETA